MAKRKAKTERCNDPLKKLAAAISWGAMANAMEAAKLPKAPQLEPSRQLLPTVDYETEQYNRELALRLRNVGRDGRLPPRA